MTSWRVPLSVLRLFRPIKLVEQLHQCPFFDPRDVRTGDAQLTRNFPLGFFFVLVQTKSADNHFFFPLIENVNVLVDLIGFQLQLYGIHDLVRLCSQDVDQSNFVALLVRTDRVVQGHVLFGFFQTAEVHEDFGSKVRRVALKRKDLDMIFKYPDLFYNMADQILFIFKSQFIGCFR